MHFYYEHQEFQAELKKKKKKPAEVIYGQLPNVYNKGVDNSHSLTLNTEITNVVNPACQRCHSVCQL